MKLQTMILQVVNVTGQTLRLEVERESSVIALKRLIQDAESYPIDEMGLECAGKLLENERTLADYQLQNESTLRLVSSRPMKPTYSRCDNLYECYYFQPLESWAKNHIQQEHGEFALLHLSVFTAIVFQL